MKSLPKSITATSAFLTFVIVVILFTLLDVQSTKTELSIKPAVPRDKYSKPLKFESSQLVNKPDRFGSSQLVNKPDRFGSSQLVNKPDRFGSSQLVNKPDRFGSSQLVNKPDRFESSQLVTSRTDDDKFVPPTRDTNCLRKIPSQWTEQSGEASIVIPQEDELRGLDDEVVACIFQRYVTSLQRHCSQPEMIGLLHKIKRSGVGGWNVCLDQKYRPSDPCLVYSFSSTYRDYSFAVEMAKRFQCEVHKFYKSDMKTNDTPLLLTHDLWIGRTNEEKSQTLSHIMEHLGHKDQIIDVLTMDINGEEWDVLEEFVTSGTTSKIRQLSVNIHGPLEGGDDKQAYIRRLRVLRLLYDKGFRIVWANRDWDLEFKSHPKRTGAHILNMVQDVDISGRHLVPPNEVVLNSMSPMQIGDFWHRYCMSMQILCRELVRMGNMNNGGWDICHDKEWRPKPPCLVYSFGINFDFTFDDEMAEFYGCEVHSFDPSMSKQDYKQAPRVYFHNAGIAGSNDVKSQWKLRTVQTFKEELGHKNRHLDILKVDVENWEWPSIPEMIKSGTLKNVTHFLLETHTAGGIRDSDEKFKKGVMLMRSLYDEGFRIFWSHRNRHCLYTAPDSKKEREACFEIYFLNINHKR